MVPLILGNPHIIDVQETSDHGGAGAGSVAQRKTWFVLQKACGLGQAGGVCYLQTSLEALRPQPNSQALKAKS